MCKRRVHGAFRKSGCVRDRADTSADVAPFVSCRLAVEIQINLISRRFLVVSDEIAHQHIEHVIVDGNGLFETRHWESMKEEVRRLK